MSVCYLLYQENISMLFTHEKKKTKKPRPVGLHSSLGPVTCSLQHCLLTAPKSGAYVFNSEQHNTMQQLKNN